MTIFHLPVLSKPDFGLFRGPGPGLGNLLFPITRALIGQKQLGGTFVFPTFRQIKIGPYIRRERDKRTYGNIVRHRSPLEIRDWLHASCLKSKKKFGYDSDVETIIYEGLGQYFKDIEGNADLVRMFLESVSKSLVPDQEIDIAIHVRLGDFAAPSPYSPTVNTQTRLEWYEEACYVAQSLLGPVQPRTFLFSDENPEKVIARLGLKGVLPEPPGNALTSMLLMSRAKILVCSRSTFSLWAQYLGQKRAIWPAGFELSRYKQPDPLLDLVI